MLPQYCCAAHALECTQRCLANLEILANFIKNLLLLLILKHTISLIMYLDLPDTIIRQQPLVIIHDFSAVSM
jgi:hypothetical protein